MRRTVAPPARSALFVPANRPDMLRKAARFGADIVIADLEDAVPASDKARARAELRRWLDEGGPASASVAVRINGLGDGTLGEDLAACAHPGVDTVMVPKITGAGEVVTVADALDRLEDDGAGPRTFVWPVVETAQAVRNAYEIATASDRVRYMGGSAGDEGDLARSLGFRWTPTFLETLFLRSKVLVDVRAAGIENPMTGVVTNLSDPKEVEAFATQSRDLGYAGMMVIHPSHVPMVNEVFGVSEARLAWAHAVIDALEAAGADGVGAIRHEGIMVDVAMVHSARRVLEAAETMGRA